MKIVKLFIVFFVVETCHTMMKCRENCNNKIRLRELKTDVAKINMKEYNVQIETFEAEIWCAVVQRKKYVSLVEKNWGAKPIIHKNVFDNPKLKETIDWYNRGQCKIGKICPPSGDCWGRDSDYCRSDTKNNWVDSREMQFEGASWDTSFREACTLDWSCFLDKKKLNVYINNDGYGYVWDGESEIVFDYKLKYAFSEKKSFNLYCPALPSRKMSHQKLKCLSLDGLSIYCTSGLEGYQDLILFKGDSSCSIVMNKRYCIDKDTIGNIMKEKDYLAATLSDLNSLSDKLSTWIMFNNYNSMAVNQNFINLHNLVNKIVLSVSRYNEHIIKDLTSTPVHTRRLSKEILEICPCTEIKDFCDKIEDKGLDAKKCGRRDLEDDEVDTIDILKIDKEHMIFDKISNFRGKESTIFEDLEEKELSKQSTFEEESSDRGAGREGNFNMLTFNVFNFIMSNLGLINSAAIIFLWLRR